MKRDPTPDFNPYPRAAADAVGGPSELARRLSALPSGLHKVTSQAVSVWCMTGNLPAKRVLAVEYVANVSRHDLRPDLYPRNRRAA